MNNLTLSDLILLQQHCFEQSINHISSEADKLMWYKRMIICNKVIDIQVEKYFASGAMAEGKEVVDEPIFV